MLYLDLGRDLPAFYDERFPDDPRSHLTSSLFNRGNMCCALTVSIGTKTARGNARRAEILEAALSIVCVKGVEKTRLSDVAESAGISVGSIQHHFGTRDDLLAATFEWFNDSSLAAWQAIATDSDARLQINSLIRFAVFEEPGREQVTWPLWIEFWALANRNPVFRNQYDHIYKNGGRRS